MRLFIAVNLPPAIREAVYTDVAPAREVAGAVKWVSPAALHVTLKFLGDQDDSLVGDFQRGLATVAARHVAFDVQTAVLGAFPNFRRPRVVWVGMTGAEPLSALARDVDVMCAGLGVPAETRPFRAHLTLGRVKREMTSAEAAALAAAARGRSPAREFSVETIDLMQSELGPGGSRYSLLAAVPLHARGP